MNDKFTPQELTRRIKAQLGVRSSATDKPSQPNETGKTDPRNCEHELGLYAICKKCGAWPLA